MIGGALLTSALLALAAARIYEPCELARDLQTLGVDKEHIATWVCIAFHESRFDTAARNPHSGDHGLLQISELYWCGPGKACSAPCSAFRDDDISDDVECAQQIYKEHTRLQGDGFLAWVVYPHHCRHNAKKYLADCDTYIKDVPHKHDVDRGRSLKTSHRVQENDNRTVPYYKIYPNIDDLRPPYISINTLLRGKFDEAIERETKKYTGINYNNVQKHPFEWLNGEVFKTDIRVNPTFKIDNIDQLKPPANSVKSRFDYNEPSIPTTTIRPTTTTIDPALKHIKPPNPRKIESNQFRKRKMMFFEGNNDKGITTKIPSSFNVVHNLQSSAISTTSNVYPSFTRRPTYVAHSRPVFHQNQTSKAYNEKEVFLPLSNIRTNRKLLKFSDFIVSTTTSTPTALTINNKQSSFQGIQKIENEENFSGSIITMRPTVLNKVGNMKINQEVSPTPETATLISSSSIPKKDFTTELPVSSTSSWLNRREYQFNYRQDSKLTTVGPRPTRPWITFTPIPKSASSKSFPVETTTSTTVAPLKYKANRQFSTVTERTTTTTQSIFDLYLRPTKRPNIVFRFPEFNNSPFKLRIFSEGTTTLAPSFSNSRERKSLRSDIDKSNQRIS